MSFKKEKKDRTHFRPIDDGLKKEHNPDMCYNVDDLEDIK